jgi:hypothetical protein
MGRKFNVYCDSGANIHSRREEEIDLDDLGISSEEFDAKTEKEKEEMFRDIAFDRLDWGFTEIPS